MKILFEKAALGRLFLKNRLVRSATWEGLADGKGCLTRPLLDECEAIVRGGVGCFVAGFTSVSDLDPGFGGMARLSGAVHVAGFRRLAEICHNAGCAAIVQLALSEFSREKNGGIQCGLEPCELSEADLQTVESLFVAAAERACEAGLDGVQIHAAHGFFLSRFISPAWNRRTDAFGGSPENRGRLLAHIVHAIRTVSPSLHVSMKVNSSDFTPGGLEPAESLAICKLCAESGLESVEVSGNGTSVPGIRAGVNEAYFKDFALLLAEQVEIPVILVGGHRSPACMEAVLNEGNIGFLSMSRPLIREPDLPRRWQAGDSASAACISCNSCYHTPGHQCVFTLKEGGKGR
ncbi:MAG: NADH:flavin oxidoreductase [Desulfovibrio sp.]|nr:NADH:flavin oxidoreductase [Desulfovibrio sp.]